MAIRNLSDILAIEAVPLSERRLPANTYAALLESAQRSPSAKALSFFRAADRLEETHVWTYEEFVGDITRAANAFTAWGVAPDRPVAFVLPEPSRNPLRHLGRRGCWCGACNQSDARGEADRAPAGRRARLCPCHPGAGSATGGLLEIWSPELGSLSDLKTIAFVDMADYVDAETREVARASIDKAEPPVGAAIVNLREAMRGQPSDRLAASRTIRAEDVSSYFCTGGTTGAPNIAVGHIGRGFRRVGLLASDGDRRLAANRSLRPAPVSRKRSARHRPAAMDARRPRRPRYAGRLSGSRTSSPASGRSSIASACRSSRACRRFMPLCSRFRSATTISPSLKFAGCGAAPMPAALIRAFEAKTG